MIISLNGSIPRTKLSAEWVHFEGDGDATDFDCVSIVDIGIVVVNGFTMSSVDYETEGSVISFNEAPTDGVEIKVFKVTS